MIIVGGHSICRWWSCPDPLSRERRTKSQLVWNITTLEKDARVIKNAGWLWHHGIYVTSGRNLCHFRLEFMSLQYTYTIYFQYTYIYYTVVSQLCLYFGLSFLQSSWQCPPRLWFQAYHFLVTRPVPAFYGNCSHGTRGSRVATGNSMSIHHL